MPSSARFRLASLRNMPSFACSRWPVLRCLSCQSSLPPPYSCSSRRRLQEQTRRALPLVAKTHETYQAASCTSLGTHP
eukprot:7027952-Pyramimonas_sp.AAC.3